MAQRELPDLILMDVQLPKLSGLDATRLLRADPRTANIPLVVVTSVRPERRTTARRWTRAPRRTWPSRTARAT